MTTPTLWLGAFDVNTGNGATGTQTEPRIIGLSNGNFLVAYASSASGVIGSGTGSDIIGRIYDAEGNLVRADFQINTARTNDNQDDFSVAATNDGGFILAYIDDGGITTSIWWERFDSDGDRTNSNLVLIEGSTLLDYTSPRVVVDQSDNSSYVTWERTNTNTSIDIDGVYLEANGSLPVGTVGSGVFDAAQNSSTDYDRDHETAILTTGELVVVYEEEDGSDQSMEIRVYNQSGTLTHSNFSSLPTNVTGNPQVASLSNGNFVVVFESSGNIFARVFTNSATPVTSVFSVESGADNANEIRVVGLPASGDGDFVVIWDDDTDGRSEIRRFNADGTPDGSTVIAINDSSISPDIGVTVDGRLLITQRGSNGEIDAIIFDPRSGTMAATDIANQPLNMLSGTVTTGYASADTTYFGDPNDNVFLGQDRDDTAFGGNGNDTLSGGGGNDSLQGDADDDELNGGAGNDTLDGGNGNDTLNGGAGIDVVDYSYSGPTGGLVIAQNWSITLGATGTATRAAFLSAFETDTLSSIEGLIGSGWRDVVDATALSGQAFLAETGGGNDSVTMGSILGNATLNGGAGTDTLNVTSIESSNVVFNLTAGTITVSSSTTATIGNFENIVTNGDASVIGNIEDNNISTDTLSFYSSVISAGGGADTIFAGNGNDTIFGEGGADTFIDNLEGGTSSLDGGSEADTLDLSGASQGATGGPMTITGNLFPATLQLTNIQNLIGTNFGDTITEADFFENFNDIDLGDGDDVLTGSLDASVDVFDGGTGFDSYYDVSATGRVIDLVNEIGGSSTSPTLAIIRNFEAIYGSAHGDTITADGQDNLLDGREGADNISGGAGNDTISGGTGLNLLEGGTGNDLFMEVGDNNSTVDGGAGIDRIDLTSETTGVTATTVQIEFSPSRIIGISGIEQINGTEQNDTIYEGVGVTSFDFITAEDGDDRVVATLDEVGDYFNGGAGIDELFVSDVSAVNIDLLNQTGGSSAAPTGTTLVLFEDVTTGAGNDTVRGNNQDNTLSTYSGNDSIDGHGGNDNLFAGEGNDTVFGGAGNDFIVDLLDGGTSEIDGGTDMDRLFLDSNVGGVVGDSARITEAISGTVLNLSGIESLVGTAFADDITENGTSGDFGLINLRDGDDTLRGTADTFSDGFDGGSGFDSYFEVSNFDRSINLDTGAAGPADTPNLIILFNFEAAYGGGGNDTITGTDALGNILQGNGGSDLLDGLGGDDRMGGGGGNDTVLGGSGRDTLFGGNGNDSMNGGTEGDDIYGNDGADTIRGGGGEDIIFGNNDNDSIFGDAGNDTLIGGTGRDTIYGNGEDDLIRGGGDADRLLGGFGNDTLDGGFGWDAIIGNDGNDHLQGRVGNDRLDGGAGRDLLEGDAGNDTLIGNGGDDTLLGGGDVDRLQGGFGNDYLEGSFGWDVLIGNDGADTLNGGIGNDRLTGGAKADVFQFALGDGTDTLVDYQDGTDQIEILSGAATFGDLSFSDSGSNAIITFGNVSIIVQGTSSSVFDAGDFIF